MRFSHLATLVTPVLPSGWVLLPGPRDPEDLPDGHVIATLYGGPGEDLDGLLDRPSWQIRVVGPQSDYDAAEDAALKIDRYILSRESHRIPGGPRMVAVERIGGPPTPLTLDTAQRTHFVASYAFTVQMALV